MRYESWQSFREALEKETPELNEGIWRTLERELVLYAIHAPFSDKDIPDAMRMLKKIRADWRKK